MEWALRTQGESGRGALPAMADPEGRNVGATFLRNNLDKRSITVNLKHAKASEIVLRIAARSDALAMDAQVFMIPWGSPREVMPNAKLKHHRLRVRRGRVRILTVPNADDDREFGLTDNKQIA